LHDFAASATANPKDLYEEIEKKSAAAPADINAVSNDAKALLMELKGKGAGLQNLKDSISADQKKQIRMQIQAETKSLTLAWLDTMVTTGAQLREKMAFFRRFAERGQQKCQHVAIFK
jgi:hypothetical protein